MLQFLFLPILPIIDLNSSTTIQKKQLEYEPIGCYTTIGLTPKKQEHELTAPFRKVNKASYTSLSMDEMPKGNLSVLDLDSNEFTRNYDVNINLPIKKSFTVKAKIKKVSKFVPQPYLD